MARAQNTHYASIRTHLLAGAAAAGLGVLGVLGWATITELAGAITASGVVVVDTHVKKVQHPTGGIIKELLVENGDAVKAGQVIVRLDDTQARSNLEIHVKRNDELLARQARLEAELASADRIKFPSELTTRSAETDIMRLLLEQEELLSIRRKMREGQKEQLRERISQLDQRVVGLEAQRTANAKEIKLTRRELEGVTSLWQKKLVQFNRMTALQRDLTKAQGNSGQLAATIAESKNKIAATELQILQIDQNLRSEVGEELASVRADLSICTERKIAAEDVFVRIQIRAPQDGIVNNMLVHTPGGVIAAGEELMQIVPTHETLYVLAKVAPQSIDQVYEGQTAFLRFSSFDHGITPDIDGTVTIVSADLVHDDKTNKQHHYVRIAIPPQRLQELGLTLRPGMPVEVSLRTNNRTVVSQLLKPLSDQASRAFRDH